MPYVLAALSTIVWLIALPFLGLHPKTRGALKQRFGLYPKLPAKAPGQLRIWMHGASAGDVLALAPTASALRAQHANCCIVVTTLTGSGVTMGKSRGPLFDAVLFAPMDTPWTVRRAAQALKPDLVVLEYTELWPQLILGTSRYGATLALHNGRFGAGRLWRYRLLFGVAGNLLRHLDVLLMRDGEQAARAVKLGAKATSVLVTGNTKFDNLHSPPALARVAEMAQALPFEPGAQLLVFGSTHEGEEDMLIAMFAALKAQRPHVRLIIAPRYIDRADKIRALCLRHKLVPITRDAKTKAQGALADVFILNTVGELAICYQLADVVFVGGSFIARGGQNILEPAALAKPVVFGPNMSNFADAVGVLVGRGGIQAQTPEQLQRILSDLLSQPAIAAELGKIAQAQVQAVRGAATRNARHLLDTLSQTDPHTP